MNTEKIANEVIQKIQSKCAEGQRYIFRGESEEFEKVSSTLYRMLDQRYDGDFSTEDIRPFEKNILDNGRIYEKSASNIEVLTKLQHYGCSTNCIDFTHNLHVALYFACLDNSKSTGRVLILPLDSDKTRNDIIYPDSLVSLGSKLISSLNYNKLSNNSKSIQANFYPENDYIIIESAGNNKRAVFQNSIFVHHRRGYFSNDYFSQENSVCITPKEKFAITQYLYTYYEIKKNTYFDDIYGYIQFHKKDPTNYFYFGIEALEASDYQKAVDYFGKAVEFDPTLEGAYLNRGFAYFQMGESSKALEDYNTAIKLNPKSADGYNNRGTYYLHKGKYNEALSNYNKSVELEPKFAEAYNNQGNVYSKMGDLNRALINYNIAIELYSDNPNLFFNRGRIYLRLEEYEYAVQDFTRAIELNDSDGLSYGNRAGAYLELGKFKLALQDAERSKELLQQSNDSENLQKIEHIISLIKEKMKRKY